jgi:O-antigen polymerase
MQRVGTWGLIGLLAAFPLWRHRVLYHRRPEAVFFEFHDIIFYTTDLLWIGGLLLWLVGRRLEAKPATLEHGPFFWPALGTMGVALLGLGGAVDPTLGAYLMVRLALLLGLYLALANLTVRFAVIAAALALAVVVQAAIGVPQFLLGRSIGLPEMIELSLDPARAGTSVVLAQGQRWLRAYGTTQHPNLLGGCLATLLVLLIGISLGARRRARRPLQLAIGLGLLALLTTFSRSAWLGFAVGSLVVMVVLQGRLRERPGQRQLVIELGLLGLVIPVLFVTAYHPLVAARLGLTPAGTEIRSVEERDSLIRGAVELVRQRPLTGVGLGNFSTALFELAPSAVDDYPVYQPVHLVPLLVLAELGPVGLVAWIWLAGGPLILLAVAGRRIKMTPRLAGSTGAATVLLVVSLFDSYPWASHQGRLLGWIVLGLWTREWMRCRIEVRS